MPSALILKTFPYYWVYTLICFNCCIVFCGVSLVAQLVKSTCNAGDLDSIPGSVRSPGEGNGNPLQYSCLGGQRSLVDCTVHGVTRVRQDLATKATYLVFCRENLLLLVCSVCWTPKSQGLIITGFIFSGCLLHSRQLKS